MNWLSDLIVKYNEAGQLDMITTCVNLFGLIILLLVFLDAIYILRSAIGSVK